MPQFPKTEAVPQFPKSLEKPCDLGNHIPLPQSPVPVMGWSYFVAEAAKGWGTECDLLQPFALGL